MGKFNFIKTDIDGVVIIEPSVFGDDRGYFMETYNYNEFKENGIDTVFVPCHALRNSKHFRNRRPRDVGVHNPDGKALFLSKRGKQGGGERLAHTAFTADNTDYFFNRGRFVRRL